MCSICDARDAVAPERTSRRRFLKFAGIAAGFAFASPAFAKDTKPPPKPQNAVSPAAALDRLMKGNARYVEGVSRRHDFSHEREALAGGQNPYASILSCADSRIAPEYAFDSGRGDLFVCRVAGNFANDDTVASLEYATAVLNSPLILVLGHDSCGAVDATIKSLRDNTTLPGHLPSLVAALAPAVKSEHGQARRQACQRHPPERRRCRRKAQNGDADPQRRRSRWKDQDRRRYLSARQRQGRIDRLSTLARHHAGVARRINAQSPVMRAIGCSTNRRQEASAA
jgi:carbonic anhydrase